MNTASQPTFFIHDYETFGTHPALDRPAQFAGVRTDSEFNPLEEAVCFYCQPADDYLPDPEAVLITGITPQRALREGCCEAEFSARIHEQFTRPGTCVMGYNNIRFDDEVTRHLFYRNFFDPYAWSWKKGNSRWDLIDIVRACYALRPEGIEWPRNDEGAPSFRLEHLTEANQLQHSQAHDALSDVYATLALARLIKQKQPRLFHYFLQLRHKQNVMALLNIAEMTPLVHVSGMFGAHRNNVSLVAPLAWHPENRNAVIVCDLAGDIQPLLTLSPDALRERLYTPRAALADGETPLPLKLVHINKCPVLAPAATLRAEDAARAGLDLAHCRQSLRTLRQSPQVRENVVTLFAEKAPFAAQPDVDAQLYDGFFSDADRAAIEIVRQTAPQNLPALALTFQDRRLNELLFRYRARNYPGTLDEQEQYRWLAHRKARLTVEVIQEYLTRLEMLSQRDEQDAGRQQLLRALYQYVQMLAS